MTKSLSDNYSYRWCEKKKKANLTPQTMAFPQDKTPDPISISARREAEMLCVHVHRTKKSKESHDEDEPERFICLYLLIRRQSALVQCLWVSSCYSSARNTTSIARKRWIGSDDEIAVPPDQNLDKIAFLAASISR
jgi:hypothetical protein